MRTCVLQPYYTITIRELMYMHACAMVNMTHCLAPLGGFGPRVPSKVIADEVVLAAVYHHPPAMGQDNADRSGKILYPITEQLGVGHEVNNYTCTCTCSSSPTTLTHRHIHVYMYICTYDVHVHVHVHMCMC